MAKILDKCPTCNARMEITQLNCTACETAVVGRFEPCRFCALPGESHEFLEAFIRNRGNVKEMERELGISYWTIRSRINELIKELGLVARPDRETLDLGRRQVLERLRDGEITPEEASRLLEQIQDGELP